MWSGEDFVQSLAPDKSVRWQTKLKSDLTNTSGQTLKPIATGGVLGASVTRQGREDALVSLVDLYATILSLAGQPVSQVENSFSIEPLLSDAAATSGRKYSFTETQSADGKTQRYALRDTRYKLVSNNKVRELYDLVEDPLETTDLYSSAKHAAVRADLEAKILRMARRAPDGYFP